MLNEALCIGDYIERDIRMQEVNRCHDTNAALENPYRGSNFPQNTNGRYVIVGQMVVLLRGWVSHRQNCLQ